MEWRTGEALRKRLGDLETTQTGRKEDWEQVRKRKQRCAEKQGTAGSAWEESFVWLYSLGARSRKTEGEAHHWDKPRSFRFLTAGFSGPRSLRPAGLCSPFFLCWIIQAVSFRTEAGGLSRTEFYPTVVTESEAQNHCGLIKKMIVQTKRR